MGSVRSSQPAAQGLNPSSAVIFYLLLSVWKVEKSNPSSAYARVFANTVQQRPELSTKFFNAEENNPIEKQ